MPGIVGLITRIPCEDAKRELREMVATLCHEKFYVTRTWTDESLGVYVGWVERLGSFSDGTPLRNERGDVILIFSGEDFHEPGIEQRLKERGHDLQASECSYLVHLAEEDSAFFSQLNGRFHGLLVDRNLGAATLFNDRYGMHRIYCHESGDAIYFAAEAKAILAVRPELRRINAQSLGEYLSCGSILENRTFFENVQVLPGGSKWIFRNGSLSIKEAYFKPGEWENQEPLDTEQFYKELRDGFSRILPRYFSGRQRVGMSLTAGLDTRMIMAWQNQTPGSLPCYTFGSTFRENHDVRLARRIAEACRQPFQALPAGQEFLSQFSHYAERTIYLTDGCADVGRSPDLYINEKARAIAPVRMTGVFGGEVLRRVRGFKPEPRLPGLFQPEVSQSIRQAEETYARILHGHPVSFGVFKQAPWHHYGVLALEQTQLAVRSPFLDNDIVRTAFRAPEAALTSNDFSLRLVADGYPELLRIPTDRGLAGSHGRFLGSVSRGMLEFSFKAEYAYDMGMPQWLAGIDHTFSALHFERLFLGRHKVFHFRIWYRDILGGYLKEILLDPRSLSRSYVERSRLEDMVQAHIQGTRNYTNDIHKVLTLELLHRLLIDRPGSSESRALPAQAPVATVIDH